MSPLIVSEAKLLTTAALDVAGVEVVNEKPAGRPFAGPFYTDEMDQLREMLRRMPKREAHAVYDAGRSIWIYRK